MLYRTFRKTCVNRHFAVARPDKKTILEFLDIKTFDDSEIEKSFKKYALNVSRESDPLVDNSQTVTSQKFKENIETHLSKSTEKISASDIMETLSISQNNPSTATKLIDLTSYRTKIRNIGERLDDRLWAIGGSFLLTGVSIGVIIPCLPLLVQQLEISPSLFGLVAGAFGLAKLIGNIPAGYYVDLYGRKPTMIAGLGMCAIGLGGLGLSLLPWIPAIPTLFLEHS
jgi:hypothetical protein